MSGEGGHEFEEEYFFLLSGEGMELWEVEFGMACLGGERSSGGLVGDSGVRGGHRIGNEIQDTFDRVLSSANVLEPAPGILLLPFGFILGFLLNDQLISSRPASYTFFCLAVAACE